MSYSDLCSIYAGMGAGLTKLPTTLSLRDDASNLWYTKEETDLFKVWLAHQVHNVRLHLEENSALLDEELITVNTSPPDLTTRARYSELLMQWCV